jgi:RNA polymerase sigma-70 factor (ECF subfamily)
VEHVLGELEDAAPGPEAQLLRDRYSDELLAATHNAIHALPAEDRTLLRLHFSDGLSIDDLGRILRVHRATAARRIARVRDALFLGIQNELQTKLRLSPSEFLSIMRAVRSHIDVQLSQLVGSKG